MNRVFNNFRPGSGDSFRIVLPGGACQLVVRCVLASLIVVAALPAQNRQGSMLNGRRIHSVGLTARADSTLSPQKAMPNPPLPSPSPDGDEPNPPRVSYEGGQLTIIAENSELSAILSLMSERTGAEIQFPPGAADERIWSVFGPGPARKVLVTFLSGTGLDYVIQASDIDPQGIRRVLLNAHSKLDARNVPEQENPAAQEPEPSRDPAPVDLQPSPAETQPSTETQESTTNESLTFTEAVPAGFRASMDTANSFETKYSRLDIVIDPSQCKSMVEDQHVAIYIGQPVGFGGTATDLPALENRGVLVRIWIGAKDKIPRMSREMFVGDPIKPIRIC